MDTDNTSEVGTFLSETPSSNKQQSHLRSGDVIALVFTLPVPAEMLS